MAGLSAFLALVLAGTLWAVLRDEKYVAPTPDGAAASIQPAAAAAALQDLTAAVESGDEAAAAALAPSGDENAEEALRALVANAQAIPLRSFSLRYVRELGGLDEQVEWSAAAGITWAFGGFDRVDSTGEIEVRFVAEEDRAAIAALGGDHGLQPIWLSDAVQVRHGPNVLVVAAERADSYQRLAQRAVTVVRRVIPDWQSGLVVELPASARALDSALGADPGTFENIAGVTSPPDGTIAGRDSLHVFLNPERQAQLRRLGAQIVLSHEAAHVALGATENTPMPVWLREGFADYIALRDVQLPLSTTAAQVIRQVRREGPPEGLPDDADFDSDSESFGAAYEGSWLACRMLAQRVGERGLLDFYRDAGRDGDFEKIFRFTFGVSEQRFTQQWRHALSDLAA